MQHTRLEKRIARAKHIKKKYDIMKNTYWLSDDYLTKYKRGRLSKNKVHCSCGLCQCKSTKQWGHHYKSIANYSASDRRKFEQFDYKDYGDEVNFVFENSR